jgi:hypothetical protein
MKRRKERETTSYEEQSGRFQLKSNKKSPPNAWHYSPIYRRGVQLQWIYNHALEPIVQTEGNLVLSIIIHNS